MTEKRKLLFILWGMALLICVSRCITMRHEMNLHPDEWVFYQSASSIVNGDYTFKQSKDYPGGAFVFQMPFQFIGKIVSSTFKTAQAPRLYGRIASVFYFSLACVLGGLIVFHNFGKKIRTVFLYALMMMFSLFQIEQSRYGTGDAISFFVLTLILYTIDIFLRERDLFYLYLSAFEVGVLTAVKFPLVFFLLYPISALYIYTKQENSIHRSSLKAGVYIFLCTVAGLLLFSPQWFVDKTFFIKTFFSEFNVYVTGANLAGIGTPLNHLASLLLYHLIYSDFPFALPIAVWGGIRLYTLKKHGQASPFFAAIVPASLLLFFMYNLFASTLFFRSYYPYYCLCVFYTAFGAADLFQRRKTRSVIIALCALMILRGGFYLYALTGPSKADFILNTLTSHEKWDDRTMAVILDKSFLPERSKIPGRTYVYDQHAFFNETPDLKPGEFAVTAPMDFAIARKRIFPSSQRLQKGIDRWESFKEKYAEYFIAETYPHAYYYIFGDWLHGTTGSRYEFPNIHIYYRAHEHEEFAAKTHAYRPLYNKKNYNDYFQHVFSIDNCIVLFSIHGEIPADFSDEIRACLGLASNTYFAANAPEILVMRAKGVVDFSQALKDSKTVSLTDSLGFPCTAKNGTSQNTISIDNRNYVLKEDGLNFVVYDKDLACVMDWGTLVPANGKVTLKK